MSLYTKAPSTTVITIATDDDLSAAVIFNQPYEYLNIVLPTLDSCQVSLHVSLDGTNYYPLGDGAATSGTTGGYATTFKLGGYQYFKVATSAAQSANRTFGIRAFRM